jgi:hypothetical protein
LYPADDAPFGGSLELRMNTTVRNLILGIIAIVIGVAVLKFVFELAISLVWHVLVPVAIVGGVLYVGYLAFGRKALGGGRRTLP